MILQENHKQFAVKCFARFMNTSQTVDAFREEFHDELPKPEPMQQDQSIDEYELEIEQHIQTTKEKLYHQLRRYDIMHMEFPKKYRNIFVQFRNEYLECYLINDLDSLENICKELQTLYGFVRQQIFLSPNSDRAAKYVKLARNILNLIEKYKPKE